MSIDRYFTLGPDAPYEAHDVFTDREEELAWFVDRIHDHAAVPWPASRQQDFQRPADNLVAFVGEGGIGKSTLVRRLAGTAMTHESTDLPRRRATATVDFADAVNREFESVLLRTRAALGSLTRSWPAFDIALSVYWGRKHPGESVVSFLKRSSVLGGGSLSTQLADQVAATLDQLLGGLGVLGAGYRIAHSIGEKLSRSRAVHHLQEEFPAFGMILEERDPERMIGFMPSLLAYDLEQTRSRSGALVVCVLDTFEVVQALPPERGTLEDLVCRLVYLMPNVLFLMASRRPPDWHEPVRSVGLLYGGPERWQGLQSASHRTDGSGTAGPGPRVATQPVAGLAEAHADDYLATKLTRSGTPAIPPEIRGRIVAASAGSPYYLALSVELFERIAAGGQSPDPAEFGGPFPGLVLRMLRDLDANERDLLRAASLLEAFDADLLGSVLPAVRRRAIDNFLSRSFVRTDVSVWPPHRLHENLRRGVNECDRLTADAWTAGERQAHALSALDLLRQVVMSVWSDHRQAGVPPEDNASRVVAAFVLSIQAAAEHGVVAPALGVQAYTLRELGHWTVLRSLPAFPDHPRLRDLAAVARLSVDTASDGGQRYQQLLQIARRRLPEESPAQPGGAAQADPPADGQDLLADYLRFELGNMAFVVGDLDSAERHFVQIPLDTPGIGSGSRFGRAGTALRRSRFTDVAAYLREAPEATLEQTRCADMLGHMEMHNGRFERSAAYFEQALSGARSYQAPLWVGRATRHLCLATMWTAPGRTEALLPEALELNLGLGDAIGLGQCHLAGAVVSAGHGTWDGVDQHLGQARDYFAAAGATFEMLPIEVIEVLVTLLAGDRAGAERKVTSMLDRARTGTPVGPPVWLAVTSRWIGRPDWYDQDTIAWIDPSDAEARWRRPLALRTHGGRPAA